MSAGKNQIGKTVGHHHYIHVLGVEQSDPAVGRLAEVAARLARTSCADFNVIRLDQHGGRIALLDYPNFFDVAFPALARSWNVDPATGKVSFRDFRESPNPPILHRKELLLPRDHPDAATFVKLTRDLEALGMFDDPIRVGFRIQWEELLRARGYRVSGHDLIPIGNQEDFDDTDDGLSGTNDAAQVFRHLTALSRQSLSAPVATLTRLGVLQQTTTFFDYGCGRGDDVATLQAAGINAAGWDPHYASDKPVQPAQIVNLGYVINVIEDPAERREVLRRAFALAETALCVSAMLASEDAVKGKPFADGVITNRKTFQKYFTQAELRDYIESSLQANTIALAPGTFLVFKDQDAEQRFQMSRSRSRFLSPLSIPRLPKSPKLPKPAKPIKPLKELRSPLPPKTPPWELCAEAFEGLCRRWMELGRKPALDEIEQTSELEAAFGSLGKAYRAAAGRLDQTAFELSRAQRIDDMLVYLALQTFRRRKPYHHLEIGLQRDVKAFFQDYGSATDQAGQLLRKAASPESLSAACQTAAEKIGGWLIGSKYYKIHSSLIGRLPAVLRVYIGCAGVLYGDMSLADVIKIHIHSGKVTVIRCDDFSLPLPRVVERVKVNLRHQEVRVFSYGQESGYEPPVMFLKARVMNEEMPGYAEQLEFDERLGEIMPVDENGHGPSMEEVSSKIRLGGLKVDGNMLVEDDQPPALEDPCGANLKYRDLIICGETALRTGLPNLPQQLASYRALRDLAENILDPVIDWYGSIRLTYGFSGPELAKHIPGRISPPLDQHAAHEVNRAGKHICPRLGAACDFIVADEDMLEVATWVAANTPFDRLYFYGSDRPIHVSYGPENKREVIEMVLKDDGRRIPRKLRLNGAN
ncbi:DNA phosphorothioation-associated putative methyltransferase [Pararhodospirillum photometricum]|nr:DNA phosphorothioation-associated putative methyltransferase [Pararhodospirillum photometricum]